MRSFITALQFLTRIHLVRQDDLTMEDFGRSTKFFPLVGVVLGTAYMALLFVTANLSPWQHVNTMLWLLAPIVLTGGLHYDGFMDTMDGLLSGREKERMLEIMKDSRVGSYGALSMVCLLFFNWAVLRDIPLTMIMTALFVMPIIGRMAMVFAIYAFPYARPEGMGKAFADMVDKKTVIIAGLCTIVSIVPWGMAAILSLLGGLLCGMSFALYASGKLGGLTGDVYGATELITETAVLCCFLLAPMIPHGMQF